MKNADMKAVADKFKETADFARSNIGMTDDPKAKALLETAAEVLIGLETAVEHYGKKSEAAWK